jgi:hypothetical protein
VAIASVIAIVRINAGNLRMQVIRAVGSGWCAKHGEPAGAAHAPGSSAQLRHKRLSESTP